VALHRRPIAYRSERQDREKGGLHPPLAFAVLESYQRDIAAATAQLLPPTAGKLALSGGNGLVALSGTDVIVSGDLSAVSGALQTFTITATQ
jgi:hypothetical protein